MSQSVVAELAPHGVLRAGINMSNFLLVTGRTPSGDPDGVSPDMARAIADRLGVPVKYVPFAKPGELADAVGDDVWDIGLIGAEPARAEKIDFTAAYVEIEATYLVPAGSTIQNIADADRPGIRIGLVESHTSALALRRLVTRAEFVGVELPDEAVDLIKHDKADLLAFPRDHLIIFAEQLPGSRVLTDRYGINRVAMAVRKDRAGWLSFASEFSQEAKASGLVRAAIGHGALRGFEVAAP